MKFHRKIWDPSNQWWKIFIALYSRCWNRNGKRIKLCRFRGIWKWTIIPESESPKYFLCSQIGHEKKDTGFPYCKKNIGGGLIFSHFFWWLRWFIWTTRKNVEFLFYFYFLMMETLNYYHARNTWAGWKSMYPQKIKIMKNAKLDICFRNA